MRIVLKPIMLLLLSAICGLAGDDASIQRTADKYILTWQEQAGPQHRDVEEPVDCSGDSEDFHSTEGDPFFCESEFNSLHTDIRTASRRAYVANRINTPYLESVAQPPERV